MRPDTATHLAAAARQRHELARAKAIRALRELDRAGTATTFEAVARASVSRSWLYTQPDIRGEIQRLRDATRRALSLPIPAAQRATVNHCGGAWKPQRTHPPTRRGQPAATPPTRPSTRRPTSGRNPSVPQPDRLLFVNDRPHCPVIAVHARPRRRHCPRRGRPGHSHGRPRCSRSGRLPPTGSSRNGRGAEGWRGGLCTAKN
jgi:hypothetical protein